MLFMDYIKENHINLNIQYDSSFEKVYLKLDWFEHWYLNESVQK